MSFIDDWRMMVKEDLCDECRDEIERSDEGIKKKRENIRNKWYKEYPRDELWKESHIIDEEVYEKGKSMCFVFRADCGGDGFSLCKKHLLEIVKKL